MSIVRYLIRNPLVKWMILGLLFLVALVAILNVKRFAFPRVDLKEMIITAVVPGFTVAEIDSRVTKKINDKLKTIDGIKKFTATSYANYVSVNIEVDPAANVKEVKDNIRTEVDGISDFPTQMEKRPTFSDIKVDNKSTMIVGISFKGDATNTLDLIAEAERFRELMLDSAVVSLVRDDIPKRQIHILLNKAKMKFYEATFEEISQSINNNQVRLSAGNLEANEQVQNFITDSEKRTPQEISNIILRTGGYQLPNTPIVRLGDIGEVCYGMEKKDFLFHINGDYGFRMELIKKTQADIIDFSDNITEIIKKFNDESKFAKVDIHENDAWETDLRLSITLNNGLSSMLLIAAILFLFLKLPIAFWAVFEMPVTILLSLILIWMSGVTINNISLCGIILTLGIIVDNPTVIGELTMYYQDCGYSQEEASIMGLKKIFKPLLFSMLTTLTSFASMFFIPGTLGDFAIEIPLTVTFMLTASIVESCLILPSHLAHTKRSNRKPLASSVIKVLRGMYTRSLRFCLKRPVLFILLTIGISAGATWWSVQSITFYLFSPDQSNKVVITGKTPENSSLSYTEAVVDKVEEYINSLPEGTVFSVISKVGAGSINAFNIELIFTPFFERKETALELQTLLAQKIKNANLDLIAIDYQIDRGGPPQGKPVEINVFHPELAVRKKIMDRITADMATQQIFTEINTDFEAGIPQSQVTPNENLYFSRIGLNRVAQALRFAFEGIKIKTIEVGNTTIDWVLKLDGEGVDTNHPIADIYITSPTGRLTEVSELVEITPATDVSRIVSERGKTKNIITANFDPQKFSGQKIFSDFSTKYAPIANEVPDLEITFTGEAKESADTFQQFIIAILGSILIIYMLLVIQFKNLIHPFLVISAIPYGVVGIIFAFSVQGTNISFLTMIGILGFGGVVINSSIIMIDFINSLKSDYAGAHEDIDSEEIAESTNNQKNLKNQPNLFFNTTNSALNQEKNSNLVENSLPISDITDIIIEGALARFRPIFITTTSSIVGFFPLAYAVLGQTDSIISPMSMGMVWGMLFGTLAALYIVPALYLINERLQSWLAKF